MKKYKANYDWCNDDENERLHTKYDSGSIEVEADDYHSAKETAIKEIKSYEEKFGGYLANLEITEIKQKEIN